MVRHVHSAYGSASGHNIAHLRRFRKKHGIQMQIDVEVKVTLLFEIF